MSAPQLQAAVGGLMVVTAVIYALPQYLRSRKGLVEGVSLPAITNVLASCCAWVIYAAWLRDPWVLLTSAASLPALIATTVVLFRRGADRTGLWLTYIWILMQATSLAVLPWVSGPAGFLIGIAILWYVGPAVWKAWTSRDVSGIAAGTWLISLLDAAIWAVYAVIADLPSFLLYSVIAGAGSILILLRLAWPWAREAPEPPVRMVDGP